MWQTSKPLPLLRAEQGADLFQCADQRPAHTARSLDAVTADPDRSFFRRCAPDQPRRAE